MAARLRVYPEILDFNSATTQEPTERVSLGDLLPLFAIAKKHNYLWLQDFLDDEVCVTADLYEILRSFREVRRPSA